MSVTYLHTLTEALMLFQFNLITYFFLQNQSVDKLQKNHCFFYSENLYCSY